MVHFVALLVVSGRSPRVNRTAANFGVLWVENPTKFGRHQSLSCFCRGKPCIRGMRITVYDILEYLASGMTETEILEDFSELTSTDIKACLAFAADREKKLFVASL